jgi:hypothetical protein
MERMVCPVTGRERNVEIGHCEQYDSLLVCRGCPLWTPAIVIARVATWLRRLLTGAGIAAVMALALAQPVNAAAVDHNPAHCSEAFVQMVAAGKADRYYFSGNWIVAVGGAVICILKNVDNGTWAEVTTYAQDRYQQANGYAKRIADAKGAWAIPAERAATVIKKVLPRSGMMDMAPVIVSNAAWCQTYPAAWMTYAQRVDCGFVRGGQ